ncbi:MAG: spore coat protein U domain-containing protein [Spirochaetales bacterium]|nr:spore coat protein U domain-containing protein [Spirochaetales bacterium]
MNCRPDNRNRKQIFGFINTRITLILLLCLMSIVISPMFLFSQDNFGLYAPPGSISLNSTYEWDSEEVLEVQIEHEGVAIPSWFLAIDKGQASTYTIRQANQGANPDKIEYQVYDSSAHTFVIMDPVDGGATADNVITSSDFGSIAGTTEIVSFYFYFSVASGQFIPSGSYADTLTLSLYTGTYDSYTFVESVPVLVTVRMARLMDVYMEREPGIRSLDLASAGTNILLATTHERSNAADGYDVSITSENFADNQTGHTQPYFLHETEPDSIEYTLAYGGVLVGSVYAWNSGSAKVTDSNTITDSGTTWLDKELRITYGSGANKPSGYYQDRLTITITAK